MESKEPPYSTSSHLRFSERVQRGRAFERWERSFWRDAEHEGAQFEPSTEWKGKYGRIDIKLDQAEEGLAVVVELKATNWDKMSSYRVRPNALRHARQLWRYVESELAEGHDVIPAMVYPVEPQTPGRKEEIEAILNDLGIQVVWRS